MIPVSRAIGISPLLGAMSSAGSRYANRAETPSSKVRLAFGCKYCIRVHMTTLLLGSRVFPVGRKPQYGAFRCCAAL